MTDRETLLHYITRLSDERIHRLMSCARANYAAQKEGEQITLTEKDICAGVLADLDERSASSVHTFAKALLAEQ